MSKSTHKANVRQIQRVMGELIYLCSLFTVAAAAADNRVEIQAGRSYMDDYGTPTVFLDALVGEHTFSNTDIHWAPEISLGWIDGRNALHFDGYKYGVDRSTDLLAGGARFCVGPAQAWYRPLFFGFQLAYNYQTTEALSSHYEFVSTLGWQGRRFSFQFRHISNGGLHDPNRGETMALVGIGFNP